ncbi:hypothetical protein NQ317_014855 [Molorchus minor]|uniref:Uncharacterized protein n=1 Tax=Molorchus minor TaxID=1323400 RepID=A0ABQ9JSJ2_9CUCU|nr:hypothetical protein NQ317_014855 [Molorchus minor]
MRLNGKTVPQSITKCENCCPRQLSRVCVALSRARNGLYIMGNMDMLSNQSNKLVHHGHS